VVRWILYFPGGHNSPLEDTYSTDDVLACYFLSYCQGFVGRIPLFELSIIDMYLDFYKNLPRGPRNGTLFFVKKNSWARNGTKLERPPPSVEGWIMPKEMGKRERLEMLSRAETFVSYDPATYVNEEGTVSRGFSRRVCRCCSSWRGVWD
jgi:hypothetical protein